MLIDEFKNFNEKNNLKNSNTLLAVSGGVDSIVMVNLFHHLGFKFGIAHCNFKLRNQESIIDHKFVENLSNKFKKPFYSIGFDTKEYAKKNKISIQMAARELRYQWLDKTAKEFKYDYIATAHHLNDNIETLFFNLIKGTGISGIIGISAKNKNIIRPLLFAAKKDLIKYAQDSNLIWREDYSNEKNDYNRNLIRNTIIPQMKKINPNLENTFKRNLEKFKQTELILSEKINEIKKKYLKEDQEKKILDVSYLKKKVWAPIIIEKILKPYGFNYIESKEIINKKHIKGTRFLSKTNEIIIDENKFFIIPKLITKKEIKEIKETQDDLVLKNGLLKFKSIQKEDFILKLDSKISLLDKSKLVFPLIVRSWNIGDKFQPLGMENKKKLSDFFTDNKMSILEKKKIYVIISNKEIVCIIGHRIDERFKVTNNTKEIFEIEFISN